METWDRVLLYGSFDGFTYSTDDLPRINVVLDGGERVEVPGEFVVSADQMVNLSFKMLSSCNQQACMIRMARKSLRGIYLALIPMKRL